MAVLLLNSRSFQNNGRSFNTETNAALQAFSAIHIKGLAIVQLDKGDDLINFQFRLIQVAKLVRSEFTYAGCSRGSIHIDAANSKVFDGAEKYVLDSSNENNFPYISDGDERWKDMGNGRWLAAIDMYDHPFRECRLVEFNRLIDEPNLLFRLNYAIQFITAFVAVDVGGTPQILAHVPWDANWTAVFDWPSGQTGQPTPKFFETNSSFNVGQWVKGPPKDSGIVNTITNARKSDMSQTINAMAERAWLAIRNQERELNTRANQGQDTVGFGALQIRKKWPALPPSSIFCGRR